MSISTTNQNTEAIYWKPLEPSFKDRKEAGEMLGRELFRMYGDQLQNAVVLGCVRGGLVVAASVIEELKNQAINTQLDIVVTRRICDPNDKEFAIGFLTEDGTTHFLTDILQEKRINPNDTCVKEQIEKEKEELNRRIKDYRRNSFPINLEHRKVILIDDGMASGSTTIAAIKSIMKLSHETAQIIVGQPITSNRAIQRVEHLTKVKEFCPVKISKVPSGSFWDIGDYYEDFSDVPDETVIEIIKPKFEE